MLALLRMLAAEVRAYWDPELLVPVLLLAVVALLLLAEVLLVAPLAVAVAPWMRLSAA
jgi:hypothetical protein